MRQCRDTMVDALAVEIPDAKVRRPKGGHFGQETCRTRNHFLCRSQPWSCALSDSDPGIFLRYAYSYVGVDDIREGVRRLGKVYREMAG
ncbi:MAG: hypothetical protein VX416_06305 [Pseudomonadota bacterium]|nr:hypothetical protein [Pseudomonadota bacterium]